MISLLKKYIPQGVQKKIALKRVEKKVCDAYESFLQTGKTPDDAYMPFIDLYCATNGRFNESFNKKIVRTNPAQSVSAKLEGVVGTFSSKDFISINSELNESGYVTFEKKLGPDVCQKLYDYALKTPAAIPPAYDSKKIFDPAMPTAEIYRFDRQDLVNNIEIQKLIMDPVLINIARNYLGCEPIFDFPALWWTSAYNKDASHEAAQLYHFDMDRIKWLKVFVYINDVTPENGPHCYVKGSHKVGNKPQELLKRGYARIPDSDLKKYYKSDDFVELSAEAGTVFAGDTKCWHKGKQLTKGHRLAMEFEYTSSMFGANYPKLIVENGSDEFKNFCSKNKVYASNIHFNN